MYASAEVRWFLEGPLPDAAAAWFRTVAGEPAWEERTDRYARPAGPGGLGVKEREGRLEVKRRLEALGEERFAAGVTGHTERWRKWSFPLADEAERPAGEDWVDVAKRRRLRAFIVEGGAIRRVADEERAEAGCSVEVGEVRVGGRVWWSVGFEAFGPDEGRLAEFLRRVAGHAFAEAAPPALPAGRSMSYVDWLAREI